MRALPQWLVPAGCALALAACSVPAATGTWEGWAQEPLRHARFFQLWARGADRMLITFGPGGTADTTGLFVLAGNPAGPLPAGAVQFKAPLARVAVTSTTHASFISALGRAQAVVGCTYLDRLQDSAVTARARQGLVQEIAAANGVDRERVLLLRPEALFTYPYGAQRLANADGPVPVVPVAEYLEEHPLGRAEWIRAFGMLLGKEAEADSLFQAVAARYGEALSRIPAETAKPAVFFGSSWKGTWSVPAGNSYMAWLIRDAGGSYLFAGRRAGGNVDLDVETVVHEGRRAEYWGRILAQPAPVQAADVAGGDGRILALPAFAQGGAFYANSAESDLFGKAVLEPDAVLRDLIGIFHPELRAGRQPVYFKPVQ